MERIVAPDPLQAAHAAADRIAALLAHAVSERGRASLAVSGGTTPWLMLARLAHAALPWSRVDLLQVDERMAPDGDDARNLTHLEAALTGTAAAAARLHPMPCGGGDADAAAAAYAQVVVALGGPIDVAHLGLGDDGHTASLAPGDPVLHVADRPVAATAHPFNGTRRVTLTYPAINAAHHVVWLVAGASKAPMVTRLEAGDPSIPAGRVEQARAVLCADRAAAGASAG